MPENTVRSNDIQSKQTSYHHRNRRVIIPEGVMAVGLIVGAHGLRGELKIESHTDFAERFATGNTILLGTDLIEIQIRNSRPHMEFFLLTFDGVTSRSAAEDLRGQWLFIPDEEATVLDDDTYWIHDIIGMHVHDSEGRLLGTVHNILETGANDVYLVTPVDGINQGREILLPAIAEVVENVDSQKRVITVNLIPGLLDESDEQTG